jgi:hypothetical protein
VFNCGPVAVDFGALAAFAQVGAIVWAGWYAGGIAKTQLDELNKNERISNTLKLLDDFFRPVDLMGFTYSPMNGYQRLRNILVDPRKVAAIEEVLKRNLAWAIGPLTSEDQAKVQIFAEVQSAATIFYNFFVILDGLHREGSVQEKMAFEKVGYFAVNGLPMLERLKLPGLSLPEFRDLASRARPFVPNVEGWRNAG